MEIKGKVALVTGAGQGMGKAIAMMLAREGAATGLVARSEEHLEAVRKEIESQGGRALAIRGDISREDQVKRIVEAVGDTFGPPDILVNNAGVPTKRPTEIVDYETAEWDRIVGVNLRGVFLCCREVLKHMRERRSGEIVNISSIAGIKAAPNVAPYSVSKFGVMALNQTLIAENLKYGIRVHAICPGVTNTSIWDKKEVPLPDEVRKRMIQPEDIAEVVRFLVTLPMNVRVDEIVVLPNDFPIRLWDYKLLTD